jgi:hypothetical protein
MLILGSDVAGEPSSQQAFLKRRRKNKSTLTEDENDSVHGLRVL